MRTILRPVVPGLVCGFAISTTLISALLTASLLLAMPQSARAQTTHTVCDEGCDFSSPEGAVSSPTVVNGDIIDVLNGVYTLGSTILVDKSITLLGNDSVFDANGLRAIDVSGAPTNFSLTNLTIRNGQADAGFGGGALRVSDGAVVNIVNVNFEDNQADFGGAAHNDGSTLYINASVFSGNRATAGNGGAIFADGDGTTNVNQTTVDGNLASIAGGGLAAAGGASINVNASTISGNAALSPSIVVDNFTATGTTNYCGVGPFGQTFVPGTSVISGFKYKIRRGGSAIVDDLVVPGRLREGGPTGPLLATTTTIIPSGTAPFISLELTFVLDQPIAVDPFATYAIETDVLGDYSVYMTPAGSYANGDLYPCNTILNVGDYD
jgi:predicted outer membrane repeat protein